MKHITKFNKYQNIELTSEDIDNINILLLNKFKEHNIETNLHSIYSELELIKKDPKNSYLYNIISNYFNTNSRRNIIHTAVKFFDLKYRDIINKYKQTVKKEYEIDTQKEGDFVLLPYNEEIIKIPRKIGHGYKPIKILPLEELKTKFSSHKRLKVFYHKGLKCVSCNKEGKYLIAAKDKGGNIHIDVYTKDFELMTVDHIKPKSLGGSYDIENLDPMCTGCNSKKSNKWEESEG